MEGIHLRYLSTTFLLENFYKNKTNKKTISLCLTISEIHIKDTVYTRTELYLSYRVAAPIKSIKSRIDLTIKVKRCLSNQMYNDKSKAYLKFEWSPWTFQARFLLNTSSYRNPKEKNVCNKYGSDYNVIRIT